MTRKKLLTTAHRRVTHYTRKDPRTGETIEMTRHKATWPMEVPDRGKYGITPKRQRWFRTGLEPDVDFLPGWDKSKSSAVRHRALTTRHKQLMRQSKKYKKEVKAEAKKKGIPMTVIGHKKTFHSLIGLANVTTDKTTKRRAQSDAAWLKGWMDRKYPENQVRAAFATRGF